MKEQFIARMEELEERNCAKEDEWDCHEDEMEYFILTTIENFLFPDPDDIWSPNEPLELYDVESCLERVKMNLKQWDRECREQ